jgi:two-component system osmolarity sensor histidine kinase EnvZ
LAALGVLAAAAIIMLGGAAISARRLTAPLAGLARAAARVAEGEKVDIATDAGPSEVRSLAVAFQSMSHRLAELDEQRELMLGGISHDLRTPLARIRVALELLDVSDPALRAEMALSIEEMDHMIGQFLQYTRSNYRETPVLAVLDDVVREGLASVANDQRVKLKLDAASPRRFAVDCVRHTLLNLVQNALEYGSPPVTVRTEARAAEISLTVQDCGAGINAAQWAEAVRPFQRLGSAPSKGHSGLGLAMVQRLVLSCGGELSARQVKDGFEVRVRLPLNA